MPTSTCVGYAKDAQRALAELHRATAETYGTLVGFWQARAARHPAVREAYAQIAEDELSHAALAWCVAAWIEERLNLTRVQREKVLAAK